MTRLVRQSHFIGVVEALGAYGWWGVVTASYYHWLIGPNPFDVVSWRVIAAVPIVLVLVALTGSIRELLSTLRHWANLRWLLLSSIFILVNWFVFVWAVVTENVLDASLGYYLNPLVAVGLGAVVLREKLRVAQWTAVGIAFIGVVILATILGTLPWIAIALGISFPLYALVRKQCPASALVGMTVEVLLTLPLMLGISLYLFQTNESIWQTGSELQRVLILFGGVVTVVPLVLFTAAARRLRLSTIGMLQYIAPTGQFLLAAVFFGEAIDTGSMIAFLCVWIGIVVYAIDAVLSHKHTT